jgi:hypothetical protein
MRKVVVTLEVEPHQYHEGLIEDVLRQIIEEQVLNGETARIVNGDISHYVEKRHGSWEHILEDGQRRFLRFELASELQRRVRQLEKKEEKS